jgi:hypothetical protein
MAFQSEDTCQCHRRNQSGLHDHRHHTAYAGHRRPGKPAGRWQPTHLATTSFNIVRLRPIDLRDRPPCNCSLNALLIMHTSIRGRDIQNRHNTPSPPPRSWVIQN